MKTTNYVLMEDFDHNFDIHTKVTLPVGSFVQPIGKRWVPKHIKDTYQCNYEKETFCFTRIGIIPIPWSHIRIAE